MQGTSTAAESFRADKKALTRVRAVAVARAKRGVAVKGSLEAIDQQIAEHHAKVDAQAEKLFSDLDQMVAFLKRIGVDTRPITSITKAKAAFKPIHANIYDVLVFIEDKQATHLKRFPSVSALRKYSKKHGLIYPREDAKAEGLRSFLRKLG